MIFTRGLWLVKSSKTKMVALGGFFATLSPGSFPSAMGTRLHGGILPSSCSPSVWSACKRVQKAGDVCTQAAFHSANMPISRWPPLALYTTELTSAHRRRTAWSENSRHLYSASDEVSLVFRAFLIPLQWKGQSGSWPKVSQSLGTRLLPGLCVHCRQVESSLLSFKKEVQTGWLRS